MDFRLLIIDDEPINIEPMLKIFSESSKLNVKKIEVCTNGKEGLEILKTADFDLVMLDFVISGTDGIEILKTIRNKYSKEMLPVILYTNQTQSIDREIALSNDANAFISKSMPKDELITELLKHITKNPKILIIDDQLENLEPLLIKLKADKFEIITCDSGKKALELLANNTFQLVILDFVMPEMDGIDTLKKIRQEHDKESLPILMYTGKMADLDKEIALLNEANEFITKPTDYNHISKIIHSYIKC